MSTCIISKSEVLTLASSIGIVLGDDIDVTKCATMLHAANVDSFNRRYNEHEKAMTITPSRHHYHAARSEWTITDQIQAVEHLIYNSCNSLGWRDSEALRVLALYQYECGNIVLKKLEDDKKRQQNAIEEREARDKARAIFEAEYHAKKPAWAKAAIVAELHVSETDTQSDYWGHSTSRVIILAWSKHTRNNFAEFRKAAKNAPETLDLATADKDAEHRENYSMGGGYYLAHGWRHNSGWNISKTVFNDRCECNLPVGEWAIPDEKPAAKKKSAPKKPAIVEPSPCNAVDTLAASVRVNPEKKGYEIEFNEKPSDSTRDKLKAAGFRWSRKLGYWYAKQNDKTGALAWLLTPENSGTVLH